MSDEDLARFLQAEEERSLAAARSSKESEAEAAFQALMATEGTCGQCHAVKGVELILEIAPCGHRVCGDCLRLRLLGNASSVFTCPMAGCPSVVAERVMRQVLTSEELDAVQGKAVQAFLSACSSSYITCPRCKEMFEAVPSQVPTPGAQEGGELTVDGTPLSAQALAHRSQYRYRCVSCSSVFCSQCHEEPYHLGYTCQEFRDYKDAVHCRYCQCAMPAAPAAAQSAASRWTRSRPKHEHRPVNVCTKPDCQEKAALACQKTLPCAHQCEGIKGEKPCLPCLASGCAANSTSVTRDDYCNICWTESLGQAPCIQLACSHVFHVTCIQTKLSKSWPSARMTFYYLNCPLCGALASHPALAELLKPLLEMKELVRRKASERLVWEGCQNDRELQKGGKYEGRKDDYAMDLFAYYQCFVCKQPYFGGRRQCEEAANAGSEEKKWNHKELVCGGCVASDPASASAGCAKHGKEFIEYKCKWCCNIATWSEEGEHTGYCWGSTHFCTDCHKKQEGGEYLTRKPLSELPKCDGKCPLGVKHPPNGTEFALGCGICRQRAAF